MKQISRKIIGMVVGVGLGFSVTSAQAYLMFDAMRTAEFAVQGVQRMLSLISEYQKVQSKQEELKSWENKKQMKEEDSLKAEPYEYLKDKMDMEKDIEKFLPAMTANEAEAHIKEKFFLPSDGYTQEQKKEVEQRRYAYLEALSKELLSLSAGVKKKAQESLQSLKDADTVAGGNIQQMDLLIQTKKTMVEQKVADVLLQAKLLELEAAKILLHMGLEYIENPEEVEKEQK